MAAPTNTSEVQWKPNGLNPLSLRLRRQTPAGVPGRGLTCHRHVIHSRAPASRPLDAIKGSLSGGQSRPPLQPSPVSLCRKEILKKFLRDCNLAILWYTVRE